MKQHDLLACLQENPVFAGLERRALCELLEFAVLRTTHEGDLIVRQGDEASHCGVLFRGRAKMVQVTHDGRQMLLRYIVAGQEFGLVALMPGYAYPLTIEAVEACEVICWPGESLARFIISDPQIALNALRIMVVRNQELQARYRELLTERVEQRLARALLRLSAIAGEGIEQGTLITLSLTREDLAELIGATLFTVSRILSQWEQAGLVQSGRERVVVCRHEELEQLAGETEFVPALCAAPCALAELMTSALRPPAQPR